MKNILKDIKLKDHVIFLKGVFILGDEVQVLSEQLKTFLDRIGPTLLGQPHFFILEEKQSLCNKRVKSPFLNFK